MRKNHLFTCTVLVLVISACQVKDHNKNIVRDKKTAVVPDTTVTVKGTEARLVDDYLQEPAQDSGCSGAIFITRHDTLLLCKGYGLANREAGIAFTPKTLACMGPVTENFTAMAILHLYASGKLSLTDPLSTFFPQVPADKKNITLHQLLTHSSGFRELEQNNGSDSDNPETAVFLQRAFKEPLVFKPGTKAVHTSTGMSILGIVIEKVSGKAYETFLRESFFEPNGLRMGYCYAGEKDSSLWATGYQDRQRWGKPAEPYIEPDDHYRNPEAHNGLYASVNDLYKWLALLDAGLIVPDSLIQLMFTAHAAEDGTGGLVHFGYGCKVSRTKRGTIMIDNGGGNGICGARLVRMPEEGVVIYMVTNSSGFNANEVLPKVTQLFLEGHISMNAMASLGSFETKGAEVLYRLMIEKGGKHFSAHAFEELEKHGLPTHDDLFFLEAGQRLISEKNFQHALALYQLYTREFPEVVVAWNDLGQVYLGLNEKKKAMKCFEQALKLSPTNKRAKRMIDTIKNV